ncbi:hypothetical protein [Flavobacterium olei]|uniref:hypothetical protein n=1 Tax=Flavobacterium olei TaxID=1886782 RepID=UPI00321A1B06
MNIINRAILSIALVLLIFSCNDKSNLYVSDKENVSKKSNYFKEDRVLDDKYKIKYEGSDIAFGELELHYSSSKFRSEEIIPFCLIMVEKYKKYKYCSTLFNYFIEFYTGKEFQYNGTEISLIMYLNNFEKLNQNQRKYLLYFIDLGARNNDFGSINYLRLLNKEGIGIVKNGRKADSLNVVLGKMPRSVKASL